MSLVKRNVCVGPSRRRALERGVAAPKGPGFEIGETKIKIYLD
jgi:hypothetical protein